MNYLNTLLLLSATSVVFLFSGVVQAVQLYGINYGPRRTNETCASRTEIREDMRIMAKYTTRLKTFHLKDPIGDCPHAERVLDNMIAFPRMQLYLGLWINQTDSSFENEKRFSWLFCASTLLSYRELTRLISKHRPVFETRVPVLIVGSEVSSLNFCVPAEYCYVIDHLSRRTDS
jgi:exo-beta-1,3-glucanase (GH17 family)